MSSQDAAPQGLVQIDDPREVEAPAGWAPLAMAFRPFFLGSAVYACVVMGAWAVVLRGTALPGTDAFGPSMWWHAHTMVFGYSMAVVAGFLLTAVRNWTDRQTLEGPGLGVLFALWLLARVLPHVGAPRYAAAVADLAFCTGLLAVVTVSLVRARRWRDVATFPTKLATLTVACGLTWFGAPRLGLYLGLYVVLAIVLTIGKRVFPFFIEKGLGAEVKLDRAPGLARANLFVLLSFVIVDLAWPGSTAAAALAGAVALINARRLVLWAHPGVWAKPILWVLIVGYAWIVVGFTMLAAGYRVLAVHALTVGGIGMVTVGMMSRVTLGHTGRSPRDPPPVIALAFVAMLLATLARVALPLAGWVSYGTCMLLSQVLWVVSFAVFLAVHASMLLRARVDGKPG